MSWLPCDPPVEHDTPPEPSVQAVIAPRTSDLGGFEVRRVLPSVKRRMVGPFLFLDQFGPVVFRQGAGMDVRPHPHIGLATMTYLLGGSILHRDSLGSVQAIAPGAVNWMTAGRGVVHSERTPPDHRDGQEVLYGLQLWVGLPRALEETDPGFVHYAPQEVPLVRGEGVTARIAAGEGFGARSGVRTLSPAFLYDLTLEAGATVTLPPTYEERALLLLEGTVTLDGTDHAPGQLLVLAPGRPVDIAARGGPARLAALGGEPLDGPRHIWWNFVSSRKERIEQAKQDWQRDRFNLPVPGETEFIPLPG
ncbi:pirin family protein [Roseomonas sp. OT10]|uniref:pirin family protein n=1 Tax=Roseomonas cutis TaxID=2897332 RepID=UPI001E2BDEA2|nr:pirin family protein [Roseomonas sp. OT10]UFN50143.1 pirin family protein [Roseomonas sp. OT10]